MEGISEHAPESPRQRINNQAEAEAEAAAHSLASLRASTGEGSESNAIGSSPTASQTKSPPSASPSPAPSPPSPAPPSPSPAPPQPPTARQQRQARMMHETGRTCQLLRAIWYEAERNDALRMANRAQTETVLPALRLQKMRGINLSLARDRLTLKRKGVQQEVEQMQRAREVRFREVENDRMEREIEDMTLEIGERVARLRRQ